MDVLEVPRDPPFKPHFAYAKGRAPAALEGLARDIAGADGYVMVSPEYNHSMSPALMDLLNHFGASHFAYKPSVIATYSAGQWGGARAAVRMMGMRVAPARLPSEPRKPSSASATWSTSSKSRSRLDGLSGTSTELLLCVFPPPPPKKKDSD